MRKGYLISFIILLLIPLYAEAVPPFLSQQGHVLQSDQTPLVGAANVTFGLYSAASGGSPLWAETFTVVFDDGYYSVVLGINESLDPDLFDGSNLYLGITLEGEDQMDPRMRIVSTPYAIRAGTAESVTGDVDAVGGLAVDGTPVIDSDGRWVGGTLKVPDTNLDCSEAGTLRWNNSEGQLEVCDGSDWMAVGTGSGSLPLPRITSLDPEHVNPLTDITIAINGSNFEEGCVVQLGEDVFPDVTFIGADQLEVNTGSSFDVGLFDVIVTNPTGLRYIFHDGLEVDTAPEWVTEADLGSFSDESTVEVTFVATDAEGDVTYTLGPNNLPDSEAAFDGATGVLTFEPTSVTDPETYNLTVIASDGARTPHMIERDFSLTIVDCVGMSSNAPALSCQDLVDQGCSTGDGAYWIQPSGAPDPYNVHCYMDLGGTVGTGWTLVFRTETEAFGPFGSNTFLCANWDGWGWNSKDQCDTVGNYDRVGDDNAFSPAYFSVPFNDVLVIANRDPSKQVAWHHDSQVPSMYHAIITEPVNRPGNSCIEGVCTQWVRSLDVRSDTTVDAGRDANGQYGFKIWSDSHGAGSSAGHIQGYMTGGFPQNPSGTNVGWAWMQIGYGNYAASSKDAHGFGAVDQTNCGAYDSQALHCQHRFNGHMWGWGSARNSGLWSSDTSSPFYGHAVYVR